MGQQRTLLQWPPPIKDAVGVDSDATIGGFVAHLAAHHPARMDPANWLLGVSYMLDKLKGSDAENEAEARQAIERALHDNAPCHALYERHRAGDTDAMFEAPAGAAARVLEAQHMAMVCCAAKSAIGQRVVVAGVCGTIVGYVGKSATAGAAHWLVQRDDNGQQMLLYDLQRAMRDWGERERQERKDAILAKRAAKKEGRPAPAAKRVRLAVSPPLRTDTPQPQVPSRGDDSLSPVDYGPNVTFATALGTAVSPGFRGSSATQAPSLMKLL